MTAPFGARTPRIWTQLNDGFPSAAFDCGVMATIRSIDFASFSQVIIDVPTARRLMGKPGPQSTIPSDWKRAIEHPEVEARFKTAGLQAPHARLLDGVAVAIAEADLDAGKLVSAAVWYGTLNLLKPGKSASRTFNDNHAISFLGKRTPAPRPTTTEYDPLADGRVRNVAGVRIHYPKGPQTFPWNVARQMFGDVRIRTRDAQGHIISEHKLGDGLFLGISVARAKPIPPPPPPPQPPQPVETPAQTIARLTSDRAVLQLALNLAQALIPTLEEQRDSALAALAAERDALVEDANRVDDLNAAITASGGTP